MDKPSRSTDKSNRSSHRKKQLSCETSGKQSGNSLTSNKLLLTIKPLNLMIGNLKLLSDTSMSLELGRHYGLIGRNGVGKTSLLNGIANKTLDNTINLNSIIYVKQEEVDYNICLIEFLMTSNVDLYRRYKRLLELETCISNSPDILDDDEILMEEYSELSNNIKPYYFKELNRANKILLGLGFTDTSRDMKEYSGGWRMRASLAKALFITPELLLLDEPSNHLDLSANIWLSEYLKVYPKTILLVSHDKYLINETCNTIIYMENKKLTYYNCNYEKFQDQLLIDHNKAHKDWTTFEKQLSSLRRKGKSKTEIDTFIKDKAVCKPERSYRVKINFLQPCKIRSPYIVIDNVTFGYSPEHIVLKDVSLRIEERARIAIVGDNGVGKSTLFKLLVNELTPIKGEILTEPKLTIGYYGQHFQDTLPLNISPIEYLQGLNSDINGQDAHKYLGMFGLESSHHSTTIESLSGGQKARVKLASFGVIKPNLLLLDEPSNHLDIITMESLITALNNFDGSIMIITHNFDLVTRLNSELWIVKDKQLSKYKGSYDDYIQDLYDE